MERIHSRIRHTTMSGLRYCITVFGAVLCFAILPLGYAVAQPSMSEANETIAIRQYVPGRTSLPALIKAIAVAPPDAVFSVQMTLDSPVRLEEVRAVARQLHIPRVMAVVEYNHSPQRPASSKIFIALGTLYDSHALRQHVTCQAKIFAESGRAKSLQNITPEQWLVREIYVFGSAHAIRELQNGVQLPAARLTDGSMGRARDIEHFAREAEQKLANKIEIPANFSAPAECQLFVKTNAAPILYSISQPSQPMSADEMTAHLHQNLARLAAETPVTLNLQFGAKTTVEMLAMLVGQYQIDGLSAELQPAHTGIRMLAIVELSIHGASLDDQIKRNRCQMGLGKGADIDEWYTQRAQVSIAAEKAWKLLSYQHLDSASLMGSFAPGKLENVKRYHGRRATKVFQLHESISLPVECEQFFKQIP